MSEHVVAKTSEIPVGEPRRFVVNGREICVVNLGDEGFRAVGDICSHAQAYLHEGEVDTDFETIECPRHGSTFDLNTGNPKTLPATLPVPAYTVKVKGDDVVIEVNE
ncbi:MAG: non-heme iron oxygenase ferredoxin subunit [Actinomycetota bacterium]